MKIIQFIFYVGVIIIVFGILLKWVFVFPAAAFFTLINFKYGMRLINIFLSYLLVSLISILTLSLTEGDKSSSYFFILLLIGILTVFFILINKAYDLRKQASYSLNLDWETREKYISESYFIVILAYLSVIFYVITLFYPAIALNALTIWIFKVIDWAYNLPVLGLLIRLGGILFLLSFFMHVGTLFLFAIASNPLKKGKYQNL